MLTVKHVVHGQEHIIPAPYGVTYTGPLADIGCGGPHLTIPLQEEDTGYGVAVKAVYRGTAYVMNERGSTVGAYDLGEPPLSPELRDTISPR